MNVYVLTAGGDEVPMMSLSDEMPGVDMPVVWVTTVDEYEKFGGAAHSTPWPSQYVRSEEVSVSEGGDKQWFQSSP